ncbi:hypothetical protein [Gordonia aurantiaca]|uniref:hypothetical protein n=1 Tax=Gordonia sp. B21 TaxID=3151852 RepID=UPI003265BCD8
MLLDVDLLAWTLDTLIEDHPRRSRTLVKAGPAVGAATIPEERVVVDDDHGHQLTRI